MNSTTREVAPLDVDTLWRAFPAPRVAHQVGFCWAKSAAVLTELMQWIPPGRHLNWGGRKEKAENQYPATSTGLATMPAMGTSDFWKRDKALSYISKHAIFHCMTFQTSYLLPGYYIHSGISLFIIIHITASHNTKHSTHEEWFNSFITYLFIQNYLNTFFRTLVGK